MFFRSIAKKKSEETQINQEKIPKTRHKKQSKKKLGKEKKSKQEPVSISRVTLDQKVPEHKHRKLSKSKVHHSSVVVRSTNRMQSLSKSQLTA
mgnify:FL=1